MRKKRSFVLYYNALRCITESIKLRTKRRSSSCAVHTLLINLSLAVYPHLEDKALDYFNISERVFLRALVLETLLEKKATTGQLNMKTSFITHILIGESNAG